MVDPLKLAGALRALQGILCHARLMALTGESASAIAEVLDWAELLPKYLAEERDRTAEYKDTLEAIAEKQPDLGSLVEVFCDPSRVWRPRDRRRGAAVADSFPAR